MQVFQIWKTSETNYMFLRYGFDMQVFQIWKTSGTTYLRLPESLPDYFHFSRLDFLEVVWTSWTSSGLPGSLLTKSSSISSGVQALRFTIQSSVRRLTCKSSVKRLTCKSSRIYEVLWRFFCNQTKSDDLTFSHLRKHISKSIAKITSALTRRLPGKSSTASRQTTYRLLQEHIILNESDPPRIVSFFDSMNH
ncbi:hypothetical protein IGI04_034522 [Brassica rapa subsp. trilocularis]|uniref:Uncharacterized protein n=1 Tax=Brassica rapa subsp. trilocularis TaxID=1813537 RepID=A0ABQ7L9Y3_BRACM|nr:hypothetical protein IGI04_034522 [Brassica rapa subsp. trilocularis]